MKKLIVIGSGGHAKVLIDAIQSMDLPIAGILETQPQYWGQKILGVEILGNDNFLDKVSTQDYLLVNGIGSTGDLKNRKRIFEAFKLKGFTFASVIHPTAWVSKHTQLGEGVQIMAGVVLQPGVAVGDNSIINTNASIDHDSKIGHHVHIAPGTTLSGGVSIGNETHIGSGATIIQGLKIGERALVSAGAVVINDIEDHKFAKGVPALARQRD